MRTMKCLFKSILAILLTMTLLLLCMTSFFVRAQDGDLTTDDLFFAYPWHLFNESAASYKEITGVANLSLQQYEKQITSATLETYFENVLNFSELIERLLNNTGVLNTKNRDAAEAAVLSVLDEYYKAQNGGNKAQAICNKVTSLSKKVVNAVDKLPGLVQDLKLAGYEHSTDTGDSTQITLENTEKFWSAFEKLRAYIKEKFDIDIAVEKDFRSPVYKEFCEGLSLTGDLLTVAQVLIDWWGIREIEISLLDYIESSFSLSSDMQSAITHLKTRLKGSWWGALLKKGIDKHFVGKLSGLPEKLLKASYGSVAAAWTVVEVGLGIFEKICFDWLSSNMNLDEWLQYCFLYEFLNDADATVSDKAQNIAANPITSREIDDYKICYDLYAASARVLLKSSAKILNASVTDSSNLIANKYGLNWDDYLEHTRTVVQDTPEAERRLRAKNSNLAYSNLSGTVVLAAERPTDSAVCWIKPFRGQLFYDIRQTTSPGIDLRVLTDTELPGDSQLRGTVYVEDGAQLKTTGGTLTLRDCTFSQLGVPLLVGGRLDADTVNFCTSARIKISDAAVFNRSSFGANAVVETEGMLTLTNATAGDNVSFYAGSGKLGKITAGDALYMHLANSAELTGGDITSPGGGSRLNCRQLSVTGTSSINFTVECSGNADVTQTLTCTSMRVGSLLRVSGTLNMNGTITVLEDAYLTGTVKQPAEACFYVKGDVEGNSKVQLGTLVLNGRLQQTLRGPFYVHTLVNQNSAVKPVKLNTEIIVNGRLTEGTNRYTPGQNIVVTGYFDVETLNGSVTVRDIAVPLPKTVNGNVYFTGTNRIGGTSAINGTATVSSGTTTFENCSLTVSKIVSNAATQFKSSTVQTHDYQTGSVGVELTNTDLTVTGSGQFYTFALAGSEAKADYLLVSGGSATVDADSVLYVVGDANLAAPIAGAGRLRVAGDLQIGNSFALPDLELCGNLPRKVSGKDITVENITISGTGRVNIENIINVTGVYTNVSSAPVTPGKIRTAPVNASHTWTADCVYKDDLYITADSVIQNCDITVEGNLIAEKGSLQIIDGSLTVKGDCSYTGNISVQNGTIAVAGACKQTGTLEVYGGTVTVQGAWSQGGDMTLSDGAHAKAGRMLNLQKGSLTVGADCTASVRTYLEAATGCTLVADGELTVKSDLFVQGATLRGAGCIRLYGDLNGNSQTTISQPKRFYLLGKLPQRVTVGTADFADLIFDNPSRGGITLSGTINCYGTFTPGDTGYTGTVTVKEIAE